MSSILTGSLLSFPFLKGEAVICPSLVRAWGGPREARGDGMMEEGMLRRSFGHKEDLRVCVVHRGRGWCGLAVELRQQW